MTNQSDHGFTLVEVLFTLFLIMMLTYAVAPRFVSSEGWTRSKADSANRLRIEGAVELYKLDTGKYPNRIEDLVIQPSGLAGWRGPYLQEIPVNPAKGAQPYQLNSQGKVITP